MQKIATQVFICASLVFGATGIILAFLGENDDATLNKILLRILMICVFLILPSFAVSVAGKYLSDK